MDQKIDFVVLWVDDSDPEWRQSYAEYSKREFGDARSVRFRDWGTLKYWFRGVEKYAPWVNNVFFITCGHVPDWLNLDHPKLRFVRHADYIPARYLPTFNANTIELNLHRISELSDRFVYFNDDTFIVDHVDPDRFFEGDLVREMAVLNTPQPAGDLMDHILVNDISFANRHFDKRKVMTKYRSKWFSLCYGRYLFRTFALWMYPRFTGFVDPHLPNPFFKETFLRVWKMYGAELDGTCSCRFRNMNNVNQYVMRYYQLLTGRFSPINPFDTSLTYSAMEDKLLGRVTEDIRMQRKPLICVNDGDVSDFDATRRAVCDAFQSVFPDKSGFEK